MICNRKAGKVDKRRSDQGIIVLDSSSTSSCLQELQPPILDERPSSLHVVRQQLRELSEHVLLDLHRTISEEWLKSLCRTFIR